MKTVVLLSAEEQGVNLQTPAVIKLCGRGNLKLQQQQQNQFRGNFMSCVMNVILLSILTQHKKEEKLHLLSVHNANETGELILKLGTDFLLFKCNFPPERTPKVMSISLLTL